MWLLLLVLLIWAVWATISASTSASHAAFLTKELERLREPQNAKPERAAKTEQAAPPASAEEADEATKAQYRAFADANEDLCRDAYRAAEVSLRESDARIGDADVIDTVQLSRNEIREIYHALETGSDRLELAFCKQAVWGVEFYTVREYLADFLKRSFQLKVRARQWSDLASRLRDESEKRWSQEIALEAAKPFNDAELQLLVEGKSEEASSAYEARTGDRPSLKQLMDAGKNKGQSM